MIIKTVRSAGNYTLISNNILESPRLSFAAKGVLCYLLSRPTGWSCRTTQVQELGKFGRDVMRRIFRELSEANYAKLKPIRSKKTGQLVGREWRIYDKPRTKPNA